jgi:hypothetical protein
MSGARRYRRHSVLADWPAYMHSERRAAGGRTAQDIARQQIAASFRLPVDLSNLSSIYSDLEKKQNATRKRDSKGLLTTQDTTATGTRNKDLRLRLGSST